MTVQTNSVACLHGVATGSCGRDAILISSIQRKLTEVTSFRIGPVGKVHTHRFIRDRQTGI